MSRYNPDKLNTDAGKLINNYIYLQKIDANRFFVYIKKPGHKWIRYYFIKDNPVGAPWRTRQCSVGNLSSDLPLTTASMIDKIDLTLDLVQWEYAFLPVGAPDFSGGYHGDDSLQSAIFLADSKKFDFSTSFINKKCNQLELDQKTILYLATDGTTKLGDMQVRHIFTPDGLYLEWEFTWAWSGNIRAGYGAMMPTLRSADVSTVCRLHGKAEEEDISTTAHLNPRANSLGIDLYNNTNSVSMTVELDEILFNSFAKSGGRGIWVTNSASYNKVYPSRIFDDGALTVESVVPGDVWKCRAKYSVSYPG